MMPIEDFADDGVMANTRSHQYRFPIVRTAYPRWCYVTAVVVGDLWHGQSPTDEELAMVGSFHDEYCSRWYNDWYRTEMLRKYPFDVDGGANGRYFVKYDTGGWAYRHASWEYGPMFVPSYLDDSRLTLEQCLDREQMLGDRPNSIWSAWKTKHPDIFKGQ